jgi:hypothetical protein
MCFQSGIIFWEKIQFFVSTTLPKRMTELATSLLLRITRQLMYEIQTHVLAKTKMAATRTFTNCLFGSANSFPASVAPRG